MVGSPIADEHPVFAERPRRRTLRSRRIFTPAAGAPRAMSRTCVVIVLMVTPTVASQAKLGDLRCSSTATSISVCGSFPMRAAQRGKHLVGGLAGRADEEHVAEARFVAPGSSASSCASSPGPASARLFRRPLGPKLRARRASRRSAGAREGLVPVRLARQRPTIARSLAVRSAASLACGCSARPPMAPKRFEPQHDRSAASPPRIRSAASRASAQRAPAAAVDVAEQRSGSRRRPGRFRIDVRRRPVGGELLRRTRRMSRVGLQRRAPEDRASPSSLAPPFGPPDRARARLPSRDLDRARSGRVALEVACRRSTRSMRPAAARRTTPSRGRAAAPARLPAVAHVHGAAGHDQVVPIRRRTCRSHATTMPAVLGGREVDAPAPEARPRPATRPVRHDLAVHAQARDAAVGIDVEPQVREALRRVDGELVLRAALESRAGRIAVQCVAAPRTSIDGRAGGRTRALDARTPRGSCR